MFEVVLSSIGRFECHRLINTNTQEYLEILSGFGGGVNDLVVRNGLNKCTSIIDGYRLESEIAQTHHSKFKGSKLSPFPNRVTEGKYVFDKESYQLPINDIGGNTNLHAFLHNKRFDVVNCQNGEEEAKLILSYDYMGQEQGYPFFYKLEIEYTLGVQGVEIVTTITNTDDKVIPIADGWHPYFHFENGIKDVKMKFGTAERLSSNMNNVLGENREFEDGLLLEEMELDDCFEINESTSGKFNFSLVDSQNAISINFKQESVTGKYKYFQIYTPPSRKQVALEPVTCPPNALNTGQGIIKLDKGEQVEMKFEIAVDKL